MRDQEPPAGAGVFPVREIPLTEVGAPRPSAEEERARDRAWEEAVRANPHLFDGPVVGCAGARWEGARRLALRWARVTYRQHTLRWVPGATSWLPSLSVSVVQPTEDGRVLVARMSPTTAVPGRWQFPGGAVEPPAEREELDEYGLRRNAAREHTEETGSDLTAEDLRLWLVSRGRRGGVGVVYRAPARPVSVLREQFAGVVAAERARGREPELDQLSFVASPAECAGLAGPHATYLEPVVRRLFEEPP